MLQVQSLKELVKEVVVIVKISPLFLINTNLLLNFILKN
jgi:hypothetical protein